VDARPKIAARGNSVKGKGFESESRLPYIKVHFCGVGNIHVVRKSLESLRSVLKAQATSSATEFDFAPGKAIEDTGWLRQIRLLLGSSVMVCERLAVQGESVLVHCSDGWDRTSQICSLAQLLMDPYFRTLEGFAALVEKDWCSFGHQFAKRCAQRGFQHRLKDQSPVFVQWLDAISQVLVQFKNAFEFGETLLLFLASHIYSGYFGNFLGNSDADRIKVLGLNCQTLCLWEYISKRPDCFINTGYKTFYGVLWPSNRKVALWNKLHCRGDPEMMPNELSGCHISPLADDAILLP